MRIYLILLPVLLCLTGAAYAIDNPGIIPDNHTFEVPSGETLVVHEGETLDIYGLLINNGNMFVDGIVIIHEWLPYPGMVVDDYGPAQQETCLKNYGYINIDCELYNYNRLDNYGTIYVWGYMYNRGLMQNEGYINNNGWFSNDATLYNYGMVDTILGRMSQTGTTFDFGGDIITSGSYYIEEHDENGNLKPAPEETPDDLGPGEWREIEPEETPEEVMPEQPAPVEDNVTPEANKTPVQEPDVEEVKTPVVEKKNNTVVKKNENKKQDVSASNQEKKNETVTTTEVKANNLTKTVEEVKQVKEDEIVDEETPNEEYENVTFDNVNQDTPQVVWGDSSKENKTKSENSTNGSTEFHIKELSGFMQRFFEWWQSLFQ